MITCVEDLRRQARRRVPKMFYDYVDSGSWTEHSYRENGMAFQRLGLRQRVGRDVSDRQLDTTILGSPAAMPVALAPTGLAGMQWADGEILAARAAQRHGVPFTLSTMSVCSIEDVAAHTTQPFWFQLYVMKDRSFIERLIGRARAAGCPALMVTMDLPVQGQRHKDIRNGLSAPPRLTLPTLLDLLGKPGWCLRMLRTRRRTFGNIVGHVAGIQDTSSMAHWVAQQFDQTLSWKDIEWIRAQWDGKLILKGIMDVDDAVAARQCGADAIVVSNHGGRQLDGAAPSIRQLPLIVQAAGGEMEVHLDSGVRSGQDVLKALALGARAVHIGRAYLYGLGANGEAGVAQCLSLLRRELDLSMALCGVRHVHRLDASVLDVSE